MHLRMRTVKQRVSLLRIRQHTSAYIRPHTSAYVRIRPHTSAYVSIRASICCAYVSILQHTYVRKRQHTHLHQRMRTVKQRVSLRRTRAGAQFTCFTRYKSTITARLFAAQARRRRERQCASICTFVLVKQVQGAPDAKVVGGCEARVRMHADVCMLTYAVTYADVCMLTYADVC